MTKDEVKRMNWTGKFACPPSVGIPKVASRVAPPPKDQMAHAEQPKPAKPEDYNQVSVTDMEHLHELKNCDPLHRSDKLAKEYDKGTKLRARAKVEGADKFKSHYQKH